MLLASLFCARCVQLDTMVRFLRVKLSVGMLTTVVGCRCGKQESGLDSG